LPKSTALFCGIHFHFSLNFEFCVGGENELQEGKKKGPQFQITAQRMSLKGGQVETCWK
jgi:hypothetical protein